MEGAETRLGKKVSQYAEHRSRISISFVLTQDCNLACGYCYMTGKNRDSKMTWEVAKQAVDYVLAADFPDEVAIFDFIGGEPLLEIDLMDQICDYIKVQMYLQDHKWKYDYMFSISTNGVLYGTPRVQEFVTKHHDHLSIGLTIDGTQRKHDLHRRFRDGSGSYDIVAENARLWISQYPNASTKVTFASDDLPYLKESVIHLWELGISNVPANVVHEAVWKEGDDVIFEQQLRELADYALDNNLEKTHLCHMFSENCGKPQNEENLGRNYCGGGSNMIAIDYQGKIYPCVRFMDYSLNDKPAIILGDIYNGIDRDRLRPFKALNIPAQSSPECVSCDIALECAWCQGNNYDTACTPTIYERATDICKMHKARVRANDYYFARRARKYQERMEKRHSKTLFFILGDDAVPVCSYPTHGGTDRMPEAVFQKGLEFAAKNFFFSVLMQPKGGPAYNLPDGYLGWSVVDSASTCGVSPDIVVYDNDVSAVREGTHAMLLVDRQNLPFLSAWTRNVIDRTRRTILLLRGTHDYTEGDFETYETQLSEVGAELDSRMHNGALPEFNVLTDRLYLKEMDNCQAGVNTFALGPNGLLYICPAYYFADPDSAIGSLETGIDAHAVAMCSLQRAPVCSSCTAYHCKRCVFDNQRYTGELNTPPHSQCVTSHIELRQTGNLRDQWAPFLPKSVTPPITVTYLDPLEEKIAQKLASFKAKED